MGRRILFFFFPSASAALRDELQSLHNPSILKSQRELSERIARLRLVVNDPNLICERAAGRDGSISSKDTSAPEDRKHFTQPHTTRR